MKSQPSSRKDVTGQVAGQMTGPVTLRTTPPVTPPVAGEVEGQVTSLSIDPEDFEYTPFGERGGLGKAHQLFGDGLNRILDELNLALVA